MPDSLKDRLLALFSSPSYMPMRKRGIAHALEIDDGDYHEFKSESDKLAEDGVIAELKRGKYGLINPDEQRRKSKADAVTRPQVWPKKKDEDHEEDAEPEGEPQAVHVHGVTKMPSHWRTGRIDIKRAGMGLPDQRSAGQ